MSSYLAIEAVSRALRSILWEAFDADPVVRGLVTAPEAIVFRNPTQTRTDSANRLSLWLYQITENEFMKNAPSVRANGNHSTQPTPMALNLYYLITPFAATGEAEHVILGKTIETFYDNPNVRVINQASDIAEELRIIFCRLTLEELTRIWEALQEPYRLSVCYQARVARIDSQRTDDAARVIEFTGSFWRGVEVPDQ